MANVIQESNNTKDHMLKEDRLDLQHDADTKLCWIAATHAFEMLNATPRYIFSYRWGYLVDGRWTGMIADIVSNKADLATNCFLFADRLDVVTYTDVVAPIRTRFIFRQPPLTSVSNIFSLPFSTSVWVAISASQLDGSIADALLLTMSAVAQQGCFIEPRRAPGRIMEWVLFAALMALYAAYSANIVVLLQAPSNSIRSLAHLSESKMTLAALDVDYSRFLLNQHKDKIHLEITKRVISENDKPQFYSINDGTEKIRQGMFALHSLVGPIYRRIKDTFLESEKCDLTEIDYVNGFDAFIPVKKDSPYLEMIRVVFKQIRESGLQSALVKRFQVQKPRCSNTMSAFSSVGFLDLAPVLIFMLYGTALSIFILIAEIVYYKM
ncbi:unnamed protein product [Diatraea saccharalis]|uniref:Ionotropic glutamate receptor C-terminal domain-containing protein n=1 Tax=Diatraea saccharalis TaxID=40085 RepID=A0A9N9RFS6_9NEOP|nr:unnamed protein product [Diatraea saccharalis]